MLFTKYITLALFAGTSIALPTPGANVTDVVEIEARTIPSKLAADAAKAIRAYGPGATKTMMHSRIGPAKAFRVARGKNLQIVETTILKALNSDRTGEYTDTLKKYCVTKEQWCTDEPDDADWVAAWAEISKAWATYAEEQTTLATNAEGPASDSFYEKYEKPILNNNKVTITEYKVDS